MFSKFDYDGDGKISYKDFHKTVGSEIHPGESLYFRQDKPHMMRVSKCKHDKCWQPTQGDGNFCALHSKMYTDQAVEMFQSLFLRIGKGNWGKFLKDVKRQAEQEDRRLICLDTFAKVLAEYGQTMTEKQRQLVMDTFPGRNGRDETQVNIAKLYEVRFTDKLRKVYTKVKIADTDEDDVAVDASGYTGNFHREARGNLLPYSMEQLARLVARKNKLVDIMRNIKEIDREHNGYVTSTELDDILKIAYPEELDDKNLKLMFRPYASIQNKILIDYKKVRDFILERIKKIRAE